MRRSSPVRKRGIMIQDSLKREYVLRFMKGESARELYETFPKGHYCDYSSFKRALSKWKAKAKLDGELLEGANLEYRFTPYASSVQVNGEGKVVSAWIKQSVADTAAAWETFIAGLMAEPCRSIRPAEADTPASEEMLEIPLFDMHFGIADMAHYEETLRRVLALIREKRYDTIVVAVGQDLLHNDDFRGRTAKGTQIDKVDMEQAWRDAEYFFVNVLREAQDHADHVRVVFTYGNHDESMSWAFVKLLERIYPAIEFDTAKEPRKVVLWNRCFVGFTHGEYLRSRPEDLFAQFAVEFPAAFSGSDVREVHSGHLHAEGGKDVGVMVRRLPTGSKTDGWSKDQGYVTSHKRFMIFRWCPGRLSSIHYV